MTESPECTKCGNTYILDDRDPAGHGMCWACASEEVTILNAKAKALELQVTAFTDAKAKDLEALMDLLEVMAPFYLHAKALRSAGRLENNLADISSQGVSHLCAGAFVSIIEVFEKWGEISGVFSEKSVCTCTPGAALCDSCITGETETKKKKCPHCGSTSQNITCSVCIGTPAVATPDRQHLLERCYLELYASMNDEREHKRQDCLEAARAIALRIATMAQAERNDPAEKRKCICGPEGKCDYHAVTMSGCGHTIKVKDALCPICGV